jgi:Flp pilus assembly pilin Flp
MKLERHVMKFLSDDQGQDLIEYTLLLAFVALASAALFISAGGSIATIWNIANADRIKLSQVGCAVVSVALCAFGLPNTSSRVRTGPCA